MIPPPPAAAPPPPPPPPGIRLRPLEIGDLFDETFRVYRRNFTLFAGISVALVIPSLMAQYFLGSFTQFGQSISILSTAFQGGRTVPVMPPEINFGGLLFAAVLGLVLYPFNLGALVFATTELGQSRTPTWRSAINAVLRRYWALLGIGIVYLLSALLIIIPPLWVWIAVGWSVALPAMFVERLGVFASFGRSWNLVEGRWWRTFFMILLILLLVYVVETALGAFATAGLLLSLFLPNVVAGLVVYTLQDLVSAVAMPVFDIAIVLIYYDLRVRREGLDLLQQAQRLAGLVPQS
jgi:hypothetical protein